MDFSCGEHKTISLDDTPVYSGKIFFDKDNMKVYCKYIDIANIIEGGRGDMVKV